jgi:hypothetical protein
MAQLETSKRAYLLALRGRGDRTAGEDHELQMAEAIYGTTWWLTTAQQEADRRRFEKMTAYGAYCKQHPDGRPRPNTSDPLERSMYAFLHTMRQAERKGARWWTKAHGEHFEQVAPGWRGTRMTRHNRRPFKTSSDLLGEFHQQNGRWPRESSTDPDERVLAKFRSNMRYFATKQPNWWTGERSEYLDEAAPGWRSRA